MILESGGRAEDNPDSSREPMGFMHDAVAQIHPLPGPFPRIKGGCKMGLQVFLSTNSMDAMQIADPYPESCRVRAGAGRNHRPAPRLLFLFSSHRPPAAPGFAVESRHAVKLGDIPEVKPPKPTVSQDVAPGCLLLPRLRRSNGTAPPP